jgi:hypothetical protein
VSTGEVMSFNNRWQDKQRKDTLAMMKRVAEGILSGKFKIETSGFYRSGMDGKYSLRVDITNINELEDLSDIK